MCCLNTFYKTGKYKTLDIYITPNIYLISLAFSESGRLSFASEIDAMHKEELNIRRVLH